MLLARSAAWLLFLTCLVAFPAIAAGEHVLCMVRDAQTAKLTGSMRTAEGECGEGEVQVGRVIDANEGVVELSGKTVQLPEGAFFPEALAEQQAEGEAE